ncbi:NAD(P)H-hydrate epimerase [Rhodopirellula europaea]|uniref:NAD(P)H-hydrate epimerase n=1 Tax=Rhodopirellula europaea 6C TaxID=1263867 RepID=M2ARA9_9BACT|nr:NAD(P)H-hydrate epimerase [Rhodopirellula europaea]EMB15262.1 carbohydrate kinase, YjeF related protein [Rhodopirellula europaea 6C]
MGSEHLSARPGFVRNSMEATMKPVLQLSPMTCQRIREIDQVAMEQFQMPGIVLMENAGRGAAECIHQITPDGNVLILCGKGNNGGDGFTIARHLQLAGREVTILAMATTNELQGDAAIQAKIAEAAGIQIQVIGETDETELLSAADVIVDGLLGTGAKPPLRGRYAKVVEAANASSAIRIALDIPTGMNGDTGETGEATFRADYTLTFAAPKVGFEKSNATRFTGEVHVISIGVPLKLLRQFSS